MTDNCSRLRLRTAIATYGHTAAIKEGSVDIRGVDLDHVEVSPIIGAFRRMVRDVEFDVCELAPTTYVIARLAGAPFVALPVFVSRRFHHSGLLCRDDAGIAAPTDLEGKRVGVRAYSVTTGVWTRGMLADEYGVDSDRVTWVVDDEEHVQSLRLPANVEHAPQGRSLADMFAAGELHAGFTRNAGIGRAGPPQAGWTTEVQDWPTAHELFDDPAALEADWYARTGIYPVHGLVVVREQLLADHPWLAGALYDGFRAAKERYVAKLTSEAAETADDHKYAGLGEVVGADPLPYGIEANRPALQALVGYAYRQRLIPELPSVTELFADPAA